MVQGLCTSHCATTCHVCTSFQYVDGEMLSTSFLCWFSMYFLHFSMNYHFKRKNEILLLPLSWKKLWVTLPNSVVRCIPYMYLLVGSSSDQSNVRFGQTVWLNFYGSVWPKWQKFFSRKQNFFYLILLLISSMHNCWACKNQDWPGL